MKMIISHLNKNSHKVDKYMEKCFAEHIIQHFHYESPTAKAMVFYGQEGHKYFVRIRFDHRDNHVFAQARGENLYGLTLKVVKNLEKQLRRKKYDGPIHKAA